MYFPKYPVNFYSTKCFFNVKRAIQYSLKHIENMVLCFILIFYYVWIGKVC